MSSGDAEDEGRRRHYGAFYGVEPLPGDGTEARVVVYGNCQAEALRVCLASAGSVRTVRMPPVHELTAEDLPHLDAVLAWADVVAAQAVADGYRGLPLGTGQIAARLPADARVVPVPNYFSTVLYPEQVLVRHEDPGVVDPPVVPYHDVRRLGAAAGWRGPQEVPAEAVRANARASVTELERREVDQGSLRISDVVQAVGAEAGWTVDHPGNPVLLALAQRVLVDIDAGGVVADPGRVLLSEVMTPLKPEVLQALELHPSAGRTSWTVRGQTVPDAEVAAAHEEFYATHPRVVEVGLEKKAGVLRRLGWAP